MSVGFGFSAGDFIAAIEFVGTVIDALRSSGEAGAEYRELVGQLHSLETALSQVKRLEFDESQYAEVIALRQAAGQCRRTIDAFMEKIQKYQPSLSTDGHSRKMSMKDGWRRIKWAVCKKEDVVKFKADLMGHTQSIILLLMTVQMFATHTLWTVPHAKGRTPGALCGFMSSNVIRNRKHLQPGSRQGSSVACND